MPNFSRREQDGDLNPRRAVGAVLRPPPSGFSQIAGKRRRGAPPNFAYLFSHLFRILRQKISTMWPKVRSPGHFEWPNHTKSLNLHQSYNCWVINIKVSGVDEGERYPQNEYLGFLISVTWGQVNFTTSPLYVNGRNFNLLWMLPNPLNMVRIMILQVPIGNFTEKYHLWPLDGVPRSIRGHLRARTGFLQ